MKILMVIHQFLPRHLAGSEVYTYNLARALRARGHELTVFTTEIRPDRPQYELTRVDYDGLRVFEAVHNRRFPSFRHTYADPTMEAIFGAVLDEVSPDVVHIQHLYLHSIGYLDVASQRDLPILYTLHEYMLLCLNQGLLLRPGPSRCEGPETEACANCAGVAYPTVPLGPGGTRSALARVVSNATARLGFETRSHRKARTRDYAGAVDDRRRDIQARLHKVTLFIAPSQFLRQQFIDHGLIAPDRIVYSDYGFVVEPFRARHRRASTVLRVGYVGTISEFKGVHLIIDALREVRDDSIECRIYGDLDVFPDYRDRLLRAGTPPTVRYMGRFENARIADALADLDVLIVPSIWYENSPLTIHEAYLAGLPVLTSDCGGMAELVEDGRTGLHFKTDDAADLRRQLLRLRDDPNLLPFLRNNLPAVKPIDRDAEEMEHRYRAVVRTDAG